MPTSTTSFPPLEPDDGLAEVHARILRSFPEFVATLGADPAALLDRAGIAASDQANYRQVVRLLEYAAVALDCPDFGMRLAAHQGGASIFGPLGAIMRHCVTFGDALKVVTTHTYAHSLAARIWVTPLSQGRLFVGHDILLGGLPYRSQTMEQILLLGHLAAMELTGGHVRARRVHFRHQRVSPASVYRRHFGCEVRFAQAADGVVYSPADLACPIDASDPAALSRAVAFVQTRFSRQHPPMHAEVRGVLMRRLGGDECTNERVAAELKLHPRTLHRRLVAENTSFQQVKDEVRRDVLLYYLEETDLPLGVISEKIGFAEQSVLTRRCRRWIGEAPARLRAQARKRARDDSEGELRVTGSTEVKTAELRAVVVARLAGG
ncbi:MAG: AraC family transcriptional regulator [Novosphingobium sp.]